MVYLDLISFSVTLLAQMFNRLTTQKSLCEESGARQRMSIRCCPWLNSCPVSLVYQNLQLVRFSEVIEQKTASRRTADELRETYTHVSNVSTNNIAMAQVQRQPSYVCNFIMIIGKNRSYLDLAFWDQPVCKAVVYFQCWER